jgi:hypothetical protein
LRSDDKVVVVEVFSALLGHSVAETVQRKFIDVIPALWADVIGPFQGPSIRKWEQGQIVTPPSDDYVVASPCLALGGPSGAWGGTYFLILLSGDNSASCGTMAKEAMCQSYSEISAVVAFLESLSGEASQLSPPPLP